MGLFQNKITYQGRTLSCSSILKQILLVNRMVVGLYCLLCRMVC